MLKWLSDFFSPQLGKYENLKFNETSFVSFRLIIAGIFFGVILASLNALYNRRLLGKFVRDVIKAGADSPENSKTLSELGYSKNPFVKYSLIRGYTLRKSVHCVESEELAKEADARSAEQVRNGRKKVLSADFRPDAATARFYIPDSEKYAMEVKFDEKGTNLFTFIITVIVMIIVTALAVHFLPDILRLLDNMISGFGK